MSSSSQIMFLWCVINVTLVIRHPFIRWVAFTGSNIFYHLPSFILLFWLRISRLLYKWQSVTVQGGNVRTLFFFSSLKIPILCICSIHNTLVLVSTLHCLEDVSPLHPTYVLHRLFVLFLEVNKITLCLELLFLRFNDILNYMWKTRKINIQILGLCACLFFN